MKQIQLFFLVFFTSGTYYCNNVFSSVTEYQKNSCVLISERNSKNSHVAMVACDGVNYLVRQKLRDEARSNWAVVSTVFGMMYASKVNENDFLTQTVWIIPAHVSFWGKLYQDRVATLHAFVRGEQVKILQQKIACSEIVPSSYLKALLSNFSVRLTNGFTEQLLSSMEKHQDLPFIVAYCFLLGYRGCHGLNIFYDRNADRFWTIDMDSCFKYQDFQQIYDFLKELIRAGNISEQRKNALLRFADALDLFMNFNPLDSCIQTVRKLINIVYKNSTVSETKIAIDFEKARLCLKKSYLYAEKICKLLRSAL